MHARAMRLGIFPIMRHDIGMDDAPAAGAGDDVFVHAPSFLPDAVASTVGYESNEPTPRFHRGLPSPYLTFIITMNRPVIVGDSAARLARGDSESLDVVTAGLHTSAQYIEQSVGQSGIQLAVHPLAARSLFGVPAAELTGGTYDGADVLGPVARRVREELIDAPDWTHKFRHLEAFLRERAARNEAELIRPEVSEAWRWLTHRQGTGAIGDLARHVFMSPRQLQTIFHRELGVGLKTFNRMLRFHRSVRMITAVAATGRQVDLSAVASGCGYADHSHMTRDFLAFTGATPSGWMAEELGNIRAGGHRNGA